MNQIPNIEEKFTKEYFVNALGEAVREMHKWNNPFLCEEKAREWMASAYDTIAEQTIHHQVQKARQDWLREEIEELEGMKIANYPSSLKDPSGFCQNVGYNKALQTIIDRYHSELDQDVSK